MLPVFVFKGLEESRVGVVSPGQGGQWQGT
jgi:hypothetical protein